MKKKLLNMNPFKKRGTPANSSARQVTDISAELDVSILRKI